MLYGYTLNIGGVESHLLSLLHYALSGQLKYWIIAPFSTHFERQVKPSQGQLMQWLPRHTFDLIAFIRLIQLLRALDIQLLHIHSPNVALLGSVAARMAGIPCVITVHLPAYYLSRPSGFTYWLYQRAEYISQHFANKVIYASSRVYDEALALGVASPDRSCVIENGIELALPNVVRAAKAGVTLCFVGRLEKQKGVDILLEAIALLQKQNIKILLDLVGDGSQRESLQAQTSALGLESIVNFVGAQEDVKKFLTRSDIFVLPSRYEAMPIALLEAMSCCLPCVVTDAGENARLIAHDQNGLVVPPENAKALAEAIARLSADLSLRQHLGAAAYQSVQKYSAQEMARRIFSVYESLLSQ